MPLSWQDVVSVVWMIALIVLVVMTEIEDRHQKRKRKNDE